MVTNDTDRLLARYFAGELEPQDKIRLEQWLAQSEDNEDYFFQLTSLYQTVGSTDYPAFDQADGLAKLEEHFNQQPQSREHSRRSKTKYLIWSVGAVAAIIILIITFGRKQEDAFLPMSDKRLYALADSTKIDLLDGEMYLSQDKHNDTIFLKGKATFDMNSEQTGSKIVKAGNVYVKDIGTSFVVDANSPDSVYVRVTDGEVQFYSDTNTGINLKKNQSGYYLSRSKKFYKEMVRGSFQFSGTPLNEVIARLDAYYGQPIELGGNNKQNLPITVTFTDEELTTVLDVVAATLNLKVSNSDDGYVIE